MSTEEPPAADHRTVNADANTTIKEAHNVIETLVVKLSRQELYDKIWEVSVAGVSKEYGIPYSQLLKQVKAADRKSTRLNSSHNNQSRMPSSA